MNLDPEIKRRLFEVELSHRQPEFAELAERVRAGLHRATGLAADHHRLVVARLREPLPSTRA